VDIASKGGNYLLNVGPTGKGEIPQGAVKDLQAVGAWMAVNGDSIYGTTASLLPAPSWGRITQKRTILYLHVFDWPKDGKLVLKGLGEENIQAYCLVDKEKSRLNVISDSANKSIIIDLPLKPLDPIDTVIVLQN
jgi:alpha-L-fucosidase